MAIPSRTGFKSLDRLPEPLVLADSIIRPNSSPPPSPPRYYETREGGNRCQEEGHQENSNAPPFPRLDYPPTEPGRPTAAETRSSPKEREPEPEPERMQESEQRMDNNEDQKEKQKSKAPQPMRDMPQPPALQVGPSKRRFTPEEDEKLLELVRTYGEGSWSIVASHMKGRNRKQVRERYINFLQRPLAQHDFTPEEDAKIVALVKTYGKKWQSIAAELPGRTAISVKNRYWLKLSWLFDEPFGVSSEEAFEHGSLSSSDRSQPLPREPSSLPQFRDEGSQEEQISLDKVQQEKKEDSELKPEKKKGSIRRGQGNKAEESQRQEPPALTRVLTTLEGLIIKQTHSL